MTFAISDTIRQYLPNCPANMVSEILPLAKDLYNQKECAQLSSNSFLYGHGTRLSYDILAQFRSNATDYLIEPELPAELAESMEPSDDNLMKIMEFALKAKFLPGLPKNGIKVVIDDGTDKMKGVVDKCWNQIAKSCSYLESLGKEAITGCVYEQAPRCENLSPKTEMVYKAWLKGTEFCEGLEANGSIESVERCFQPVGELTQLPLLSEVCTWDPPKYVRNSGLLPAIERLTFLTATVGTAYFAYQQFRKHGLCKTGVGLSALSLGCFALFVNSS
ncbi:MAG: hypothetical protein JSS30_07980 [Verrucomicrobia bacterium]|nr:hypothetical protein [Verrucomicrobiota bacterium]